MDAVSVDDPRLQQKHARFGIQCDKNRIFNKQCSVIMSTCKTSTFIQCIHILQPSLISTPLDLSHFFIVACGSRVLHGTGATRLGRALFLVLQLAPTWQLLVWHGFAQPSQLCERLANTGIEKHETHLLASNSC